ncbi:alpha glucoside transporter [Dactylonectria macrodidyma]|uniref:Alpha glucoside transporter n=1 Tax=Dactylonectria macrodidyma TaxID=307937 RepID=A0A9P9JJA9_9HYPO|nr:alpha glucoside transporter [Dactylonectria macrodidyma]
MTTLTQTQSPIGKDKPISTMEPHIPEGTAVAVDTERGMTVKDSLRLWPKAIIFSFLISLAIIMEGYDTSLMSNFWAYPAFVERFGDEVDNDGNSIVSARWQTIILNSTQVGSIIGLFINGIVTEWLGYRKTMIITMIAMIGAIFIPFFSTGLPMFLAGGIVQGIPWGIFQTLAVTYAADICPLKLRGYMTSWINMCWVIGQFIAVGILNGFIHRDDEWSYRIPFAIQWTWPIPIIMASIFAPESPWWLIRHDRTDEARAAIQKLTTPRPDIDFDIDAHLEMMRLTVKFEAHTAGAGGHYWDCFRGADRRRTEIAAITWTTHAFCGAPFIGYGIQFMIQAGLDPNNGFSMSLGQMGLSLTGCLVAWWVMTHVGRRTMYVTGLAGMTVILLVIGFLGLAPRSNSGASWAVGALIMVMVLVFQLTVGPSCYTIVAETPSSQLRVKTVAIARASYNAGGFITNALMPQIIGRNAWNWGAKGGFFWAGIAFLFLVWTWFRLPETMGLTYTDLDLLFEHGVPTRKFSPEAADILRPQLQSVAEGHDKATFVQAEVA